MVDVPDQRLRSNRESCALPNSCATGRFSLVTFLKKHSKTAAILSAMAKSLDALVVRFKI